MNLAKELLLQMQSLQLERTYCWNMFPNQILFWNSDKKKCYILVLISPIKMYCYLLDKKYILETWICLTLDSFIELKSGWAQPRPLRDHERPRQGRVALSRLLFDRRQAADCSIWRGRTFGRNWGVRFWQMKINFFSQYTYCRITNKTFVTVWNCKWN